MKGKIINDPVYGFIRFPEPEVLRVIAHPKMQRLRRIRQMGMANLVYPGAEHTRFHHSLGACHLMEQALSVLKGKGVTFSDKECVGARLAILLHDVGHGPFSHALEHLLAKGVHHEQLSMLIMQRLNKEMNGMLETAMSIFSHTYPKKYLHQLVSSQLDMDRMDYLNRDSFYTGVSEGVIGYDRILQMLTVHNDELMVEEKAVHSAEKFIIARRLMYWQVYLHKTVLGAELLLINIMKRAKELAMAGRQLFATPALQHFLYNDFTHADFQQDPIHLDTFCRLDDTDILSAIKVWCMYSDTVLSKLCTMLINRNLYRMTLSAGHLNDQYELESIAIQERTGISDDLLHYFIFTGQTGSSTYNTNDERIFIVDKSSRVLDISQVEDALVTQTLARPVVKNYLCRIRL